MHFHGSAEQRPTPRQLAPVPAHFTNRFDELTELKEATSSDQPAVVVLSGLGGVGKTALALRWLHESAPRFPDGQLYADLADEGHGPADPATVLGGFLRSFGVGGEELPSTLSQRLGWFRTLTADKKVAILLDNASTAAQVRALLPSSPGSLVLVTTRRRLGSLVVDGARFVDVHPLSIQDAAVMLEHTVGGRRVSDEPDMAQELARLCGGLPIAVSVIAARLATRRRLRVRDAVAELRVEQHRLSLLSRDDEVAVEPVFDLTYQGLATGPQAMYRALGLHAGSEFSLAVAAAGTGLPLNDAAADLDSLVEANLVDELGNDRYRLHDLLRLHARHLAHTHNSRLQRAAVARRIAEYYLLGAQATWPVTTAHLRGTDYTPSTTPPSVPSFTEHADALDWLEQERANILAAAAVAYEYEWWATAWQLTYAVWPLFRYHGHHTDWRAADELAICAAQAMNNPEWEARARRRLAMLEQRVGDYARADQLLARCHDLFASVDDAYGVANTADARAVVALSQKRAGPALHYAQRARDAFTELGRERKAALAKLVAGQAQILAGLPREGMATLHAARTALAPSRNEDPFNVARADLVVGQAMAASGDPEAAGPLVEAGSNAMQHLASLPGQALAHHAHATLAHARTNPERERFHLEEAIRLFDHLGDATANDLRAQLNTVTAAPNPDPIDPP